MTEYIDKDRLKEEFLEWFCNGTNDVFIFIDDILMFIDEAETEDVTPVKYGKWIEDGYKRKENVCSQCGSELPLKSEGGKIPKKQVKFCYYCGAKMDLGE